MKKFALALASMLLVLSAAGAVAAVPSKTTTDVTRVKAVESTEPTMLIKVTEDAAPVAEEIARIYQQVAVNGQAAVSYFPAETQSEIIALLPEGVKSSAMIMNEFVTLTAEGTAADGKVTFTFTTRYTVDQKVVVVIGLYDGTRDANGQYNVEWVVLNAEVLESGDIAVEFPVELVERMKNAVATAMAVLND